MVQDRCIVSLKVEQKVICAVSNGDIADDFGWPKPPNHPYFDILHCLSYLLIGWP